MAMPHAGMTARNAIGRDRPRVGAVTGWHARELRAGDAAAQSQHHRKPRGKPGWHAKTRHENLPQECRQRAPASKVHSGARAGAAPGLRCPHGGLLASSIDIRSGLIRRRPRLYIQACMYNAPTGAAGACASLAVSPPDDGVVRREIALSAAGLLARCPVRGRAGPRIGRACRCERRAGRRTAARRPRRVDRLRALRHAAPARSHRAG